MALNYISSERDQPFLLPPDMRDWLPEQHLAWFVLDVLERVDISALHARHPNLGPGRAAYNPEMLLALLLYAYCTGVRSSRQVERLCEVDVAYRVIAANQRPDHTTIARFRQACDELIESLFAEVLGICAEAGLVNVDVVAVDGTKMAANAAADRNRDRAQLEALARQILDEHARVDAAEDEAFGDRRGDELRPEFVDPKTRRAAIDKALRELRRQEQRPPKRGPSKAKAQAQVADAEAAFACVQAARVERRAQVEARAVAEGRKVKGPPPGEGFYVRRAKRRLERARARAEATPPPEVRVNLTDPDSRLMPTQQGFVQGYNAQVAVNEHGIVLAGEVTQHQSDTDNFAVIVHAAQRSLADAGVTDDVGVMLLDAGYWSEHNITAEGPPRLIADTKGRKLITESLVTGPPPEHATPREKMRHELRTFEGKALYARRGQIVEPVFGQHKEARGFRRFMRRGLPAGRAEWALINATHNILKLFRARPVPAVA